jgi:hypothetical protein
MQNKNSEIIKDFALMNGLILENSNETDKELIKKIVEHITSYSKGKSEEPLWFSTYWHAQAWMINLVDDRCIDNIRSTFIESVNGMETYLKRRNRGCCGFFDQEIIISGERALIGCNYGH